VDSPGSYLVARAVVTVVDRCFLSVLHTSGAAIADDEPVDTARELSSLLGSLAREDGVFSLVGPESEGSVAEQVRKLVEQVEGAWQHYAVPGASRPTGGDTGGEWALGDRR
jgi:hypothetical protein